MEKETNIDVIGDETLIRKGNKFYTKTAKEIFEKELENRRKEFEKK